MKPVAICVNGPAGAGKDTIVDHLVNSFGWSPEKFALPIEKGLRGFLCLSKEEFKILRNERKDEIVPGFKVTFRQMMIDFSEKYVKECYGDATFGTMCAERIQRKSRGAFARNFGISDSGFNCEFGPFKEALRGTHDVYLFRVDRPGHTFDGDSREYVDRPDFKFVNDGTIQELNEKVTLALMNMHRERIFTPMGVVG